jgi:hypothetical protein
MKIRDNLRELGVDGRIKLKYLKKYDMKLWIAFIRFRQGQMAVMKLEVPLMERYF